jgi:HupE / UreJ protein
MEKISDMRSVAFFFIGFFVFLSHGALAHSRNYTSFVFHDGELSVDLKLKDLETYFPGFQPADLVSRKGELEKYVIEHFRMEAEGKPCPISSQASPKSDADHSFALFSFLVSCPAPAQKLTFFYDLFFDKNPDHVGVLVVERNGAEDGVSLMSNDQRVYRWAATEKKFPFFSFLKEGVWHILIGFDHILFLLVLLLATVADSGREKSFHQVCVEVFKTVTAFTLSHSLTLFLAALGVIIPSSRWVETIIALSIVIAALNNLISFLPGRAWLIAFVFGFIHGFGFASVLEPLIGSRTALLPMILGFNLGVELGQIVIVAFALPVIYGLGRTQRFTIFAKSGSVLALVLALLWAVERACELSFMPF